MVPLSEFNDRQLERDFHFIDDCNRQLSNAQRGISNVWRFSFRALPPPLHALREAAKKRGVVCQITSEGMSKREKNTSRYDRRRDAILWHIEFEVRGKVRSQDFTASTSWGNERFLLQDIFQSAWLTNPRLLCYHIRRGYNRASSWVGAGGVDATTSDTAAPGEVSEAGAMGPPGKLATPPPPEPTPASPPFFPTQLKTHSPSPSPSPPQCHRALSLPSQRCFALAQTLPTSPCSTLASQQWAGRLHFEGHRRLSLHRHQRHYWTRARQQRP